MGISSYSIFEYWRVSHEWPFQVRASRLQLMPSSRWHLIFKLMIFHVFFTRFATWSHPILGFRVALGWVSGSSGKVTKKLLQHCDARFLFGNITWVYSDSPHSSPDEKVVSLCRQIETCMSHLELKSSWLPWKAVMEQHWNVSRYSRLPFCKLT